MYHGQEFAIIYFDTQISRLFLSVNLCSQSHMGTCVIINGRDSGNIKVFGCRFADLSHKQIILLSAQLEKLSGS